MRNYDTIPCMAENIYSVSWYMYLFIVSQIVELLIHDFKNSFEALVQNL
jgi:hypothetical protein